MSNIIHHNSRVRKVLIGDREYDPLAESRAENRLRSLFPLVAVLTHPDGSKQIPIEEVFKIENEHIKRLSETKKEGYDQGRKQGHDAGLQEGLAEAKKVLEQFNRAVNDAVTQREGMLNEARHHILELVMQISKKVTFDTIKLDQDMVVSMIARVIDHLVDKSHIKIKVHPDHLPVVEQSINRFLSESVAIKNLSFEADPRVKYGGCFIETPSGDIDARLLSQFEVIEQTILDSEN